jgi:hypothetical protein
VQRAIDNLRIEKLAEKKHGRWVLTKSGRKQSQTVMEWGARRPRSPKSAPATTAAMDRTLSSYSIVLAEVAHRRLSQS